MQLLFVIGCVAERASPRNFFALGGKERLVHGATVGHLPSSKLGYTLSFWMRVGAQADGEPEVSVLQLPSASGQRLIEVDLAVREADAANALRTRALRCPLSGFSQHLA